MTILDDAAKAVCCGVKCLHHMDVCISASSEVRARAVLEVVAKWMDDEAKALTQRIPNKFGNYAKDNLISRADQLQRCVEMLRKDNR